jgi:2-polyprenyl-6-methoxyphenol hydroxylase-like FAD-dependent oxidoreductase
MNARRGSKRCRAARQPWSRFSGHIIGKGAHVIEAGAKLGVEGIVSKQVDTRLGVWRRKPVPPPARHRLGRFSKPNVLDLDNWQIAYREAEAGYVVYPARDNTELRVGLGFAAQMTEEQRAGVERQKAFVAERCAHLRWEIPRLLELMRDAQDFNFGAMAQVQMDCWSKGRVALVGDAAYCPTPMSGQGISLALVGANVTPRNY